MLSPFAIERLLRYFNSIDIAVTSGMTSKWPPGEEELTRELVRRLDDDEQDHGVPLGYTKAELNADLDEAGEPIRVEFSLETHQHPKKYENRVSQADLGLIVRYVDHYAPRNSGQRSWVLQAKRVFPDSTAPTVYSVDSEFKSMDDDQEERINELVNLIDADFFRYLLYCPRPETLKQDVRRELTYHRNQNLGTSLFDYAYGQALHADLRNGGETVSAGLFITGHNAVPTSLKEVHRGLMRSATPFAWFLLQHFPYQTNELPHGFDEDPLLKHSEDGWAPRIAAGDKAAIEHVTTKTNRPAWNGKWVPHATLTLTVSVGSPNGQDLRG